MNADDRLGQDLQAIQAWLEHRHGALGQLWLHAMRAPSQHPCELSIAMVDTDRTELGVDRLQIDLLAALEAIGYRVAWPRDGAEPEDVDVPSPLQMGRDDRSAAIARIEQAVSVPPRLSLVRSSL